METDPAANLHSNSGEIPKSYFRTIVFLDDWWLIKAQKDLLGTRIFIAGYTVEERLCSLLPIHERNEEHHLETIDGKCVIIRGRHNEARSAENGFASNICKHFGWGFPPYWKEFVEKYMVKEPPCMNDVQPNLEELPNGDQVNIGSDDSNSVSQDTKANKKQKFEKAKSTAVPLLHKAGSNHTSVTGDQPNSGIPAINLGSKGREDDKSRKTKQRAKRSKLSDVPLLQKTDSPIISAENISSISCISDGIEDLFDGGPSIGDHTTEDMPVNCMNSINSFGEEVDTFVDKDLDDSEIDDSVRSLSACRSSHPYDIQHNLQADKDTHSSENIIIHAKGTPGTRSASRLKTKHDGQTSTMIPAEGICISADISTKLDTDSVMDISDQLPETMKDLKKVRTRSSMQKTDKETKSLGMSATADNGGLRETGPDKDKNLSKDILIPSRDSVSRLDTEHNNQASATIPVTRLFGSEEKSSELNPVSVKDKSEKPAESVNQVDQRKVETRSNTQKKANSKATKSPSTSVSTDNDGLRRKELDTNKNMPKHPVGRPKKQKKNIPGTGPSGSEDISAEDNFEQLLETQKQVKDGVKFKTTSKMQQKENDKTTKSFCGPTSADTGKQTATVDTEKGTVIADTNLSEKATPPSMNRRRKIEFETPDGGNEKVSFDSPQSSTFKRSRSGRVQMRPMEYWRNEIPIYSPDRTLTAVTEEGNAGQPGIGSMSAHKRKGRKLL